jgi:hypothetical protein
VKTNGTQCGSPALRRRRHCYFHDGVHRERARIAANGFPVRRFDLPLLEDANAVQMALMKVIHMLGSGQMDHKTAGLMLYALQTASNNLRNTEFEASDVTDVVIDRSTVQATCINGPQWFEDDFEDDVEDVDEKEGELEDEAEDEAEDEGIAAQPQTSAGSGEKPAAKKEVKGVSAAEARKQVQALARNFVLEALARKPPEEADRKR